MDINITNSNKCIRILRIVSVMNRGGIETQIMNMYRKIDRSKFQFDFLITRDEKGVFDKEILALGGKIYKIPGVRDVGLFSFIKSVNCFFKSHKEYKIVHSHMNTWSGLFLKIAKNNGVKVRIAQAHSAQQGYKVKTFKGRLEFLFKSIMKFFIKFNATHYWAVGHVAGEWLFGKKIANTKMKIIPNAKDLESYKFNLINRNQLRKEFDISDDAFVIGHVGSYSAVKNHAFLVELFKVILTKEQEVYLCLVGDGVLKTKIETVIKNSKIEEYVKILGLRNDVNILLSMFDALLLPSIFEGMPNVVIEAQAASLPCVISSNITNEVDMNMNLVKYVSLSSKFGTWIDIILSCKDKTRDVNLNNLYSRGYDLNKLIIWLEEFYQKNYK